MGKDSIRVSSGIKRIEVNDEGEYITLNINDANFISKFNNLRTLLYQKADQFDAKAEEIKNEDISDEEKISKALQFNCDIIKDVMVEIDALFGENACQKIFGKEVVPDPLAITELFEAIMPFIQELQQEKLQRISKYSPNRMGNT